MYLFLALRLVFKVFLTSPDWLILFKTSEMPVCCMIWSQNHFINCSTVFRAGEFFSFPTRYAPVVYVRICSLKSRKVVTSIPVHLFAGRRKSKRGNEDTLQTNMENDVFIILQS